MKTTLEIPDALFRKAKARASAKGIALAALLNEAVEAHLATSSEPSDAKPWMSVFGGLKRDAAFHAETQRIDAAIEEEFEHLDPEDCR